MKLLTDVPKLHQRAEEGLKAQGLAAQGIQELKRKSSAWVDTFDKFFGIAVSLGLGAAGDTIGAMGAASVVDWVSTGASMASDFAGTVDSLGATDKVFPT